MIINNLNKIKYKSTLNKREAKNRPDQYILQSGENMSSSGSLSDLGSTSATNLIDAISFKNLSVATLSAFAVLYLLFQKKLLPHGVAKWASKVLFYPTFPFTLIMRIGNYYTKVDETVYLGCAPMDLFNIPNDMAKDGVKAVVNMCYEYGGPQASYDRLKIQQLRLRVVDHFEPSADQLNEAVRFISDYKSRGERVYVHCKAGHGRAAAVALAWMIHENPQKSPADLNAALGVIRKVRKNLYQQKNIIEFVESRKGKETPISQQRQSS